MTLAALVAAYDGDADGLRALQPLAGVSVLEHQARRLAAAGVGRIVLLLDEGSAALTAPPQRLRADGLSIEIARGVADAAERLGGEPRILLLADACLPSRALLEWITAAPAPTLAVVEDIEANAAFERIDADARWAGVAMIDGAALAEMAAMVGDWDPVSTLLRRAVQQNAARLDATGEEPALAALPGAIAKAEAKLLDASREIPSGWAGRFIEAPLAGLALPQLFARNVTPTIAAAASVASACLGGLVAMLGYPGIGLALALPSGILARIASRLTLVQSRPLPWPRSLRIARLAGLGLGALGIGRALHAGDGQWGWLVLATLLVLTLAALAPLRRTGRRLLGEEAPVWLARGGAMPWALLPFALAGRWGIGLALLSLYAIGSLGWVIARLARDTD